MTLSEIFIIFVKQMPRWCNGSHEGLKIPWSVNGREGSSPSLGTMNKRCSVSLVTFFKDVIVNATTIIQKWSSGQMANNKTIRVCLTFMCG